MCDDAGFRQLEPEANIHDMRPCSGNSPQLLPLVSQSCTHILHVIPRSSALSFCQHNARGHPRDCRTQIETIKFSALKPK